jgi:outer membrane protein TolC
MLLKRNKLAAALIPIYEGGAVYSRIREAKQTASQRALEILEVRRQVRQQVTEAWNLLLAAKSTIRAAKAQVEANRLALEGVQQEMRAGSRTVLDVLDAEQELVDSQVLLASAERDRIITGYQLIASVGRMTARDLNRAKLPGPEANSLARTSTAPIDDWNNPPIVTDANSGCLARARQSL